MAGVTKTFSQILIFSSERRGGPRLLPAPIVAQPGPQGPLLSIIYCAGFQATKRLTGFNYQPIKRSYFIFSNTLILMRAPFIIRAPSMSFNHTNECEGFAVIFGTLVEC